MATIIQPYNGWREKLAVDVLGGLIGGILQRSQQANQNRKLNALRGVVQEELNAMNAPQQQAAPQITPSDYNSNGWQEAFHSMENPMAQFNAGTADTAPSVTPQVNRYPTQADIQGIIARNLATKRFGMLDPKLVQETLTPYLQAAESARNEQRKQALADAVLNAPDALGRRNQANAGYINGLLDIAGLNAFQNQYIADRPSPVSFNTGSEIITGNRNPDTGQITYDDKRIPLTLTPQQVQQGIQWKQIFDANERQRVVDNSYRQTQADRVYGLQKRAQTEAETQGQWKRDTDRLEGTEGTYRYNPITGEYEEIRTSDGQPIITRPKYGYGYGYGRTGSKSTYDPKLRELIKTNTTMWKTLNKDRSDWLIKKRAFESDQTSPQYQEAVRELERIDKQLAEIDTFFKGLSGEVSKQTGDDFADIKKKVEELNKKETALEKIKTQLSPEAYEQEMQKIKEERNKIFNDSFTDEPGSVLPYPPSSSPSSTSSTQKKNNNVNLGSMFLGNAYGGNLTSGKKFGAKRAGNPKLGVKPHDHKGIDLEARHGSRITAPDILGDNVKVVSVSDNPNSGLGCNVVLEGTVDGKRYTYVLAHLAEGSIRVQPGDIIQPGDLIGQVGNTGNSRGPHLHFEVREGGAKGKPIDPERFFADYGARQTQTQPQLSVPNVGSVIPENPNAQPTQPVVSGDINQLQIGTQPQSGDTAPQQTQPMQITHNDNDPAWRSSADPNDVITMGRYKQLQNDAQAGRLRQNGINNAADLEAELQQRGYVSVPYDDQYITKRNVALWVKSGDPTNSITMGAYEKIQQEARKKGMSEADIQAELRKKGYIPTNNLGVNTPANPISGDNAPLITVRSPDEAPSIPLTSNDFQIAVPSSTTSGDVPPLAVGIESGDHSPAPAYTDRINGTTEAQNQEQMNKLNGVENSNIVTTL